MEKTESKSFQVHPSEEQYYIDLMQQFHWNLQSSQEINVKDSHMEVRSNKLYSITESQHYVKLVFTRPADFQNKQKYVDFENEYFGMQYPNKASVKGAMILGLIGLLSMLMTTCSSSSIKSPFLYIGLIIIAGSVFWVINVNKKNKEIQDITNSNNTRRQGILSELTSL